MTTKTKNPEDFKQHMCDALIGMTQHMKEGGDLTGAFNVLVKEFEKIQKECEAKGDKEFTAMLKMMESAAVLDPKAAFKEFMPWILEGVFF